MSTAFQLPAEHPETSVAGFTMKFPRKHGPLSQDQEWCQVLREGQWRAIRFHDYHDVYDVPGLYEAIFYQRLRCCSPFMVVRLLADVLSEYPESISDMRVLDVGAGNGLVGQELRAQGAPHVVGIDILPQAREAAFRDRPGVYDDYLVADLTALEDDQRRRLVEGRLNALTCVAALGFGDIPTAAFANACNAIDTPGWLAFNIKEDFLDEAVDRSGFSRMVQRLMKEKIIQVHAYRRYRHRLSVHGDALHYIAVVATKQADIPLDMTVD